MSIRITGLSDAMRILNSVANDHPKKLKQQTRESARIILNNAKRKAPKLTGKLRNSGFVEELKGSNGFGQSITFSVDYAPFMEFGTGGLVDIPSGFEELATQFKGSGKRKINLKPQPFLIPAFLDEKPNYISQCEKIVQNKI